MNGSKLPEEDLEIGKRSLVIAIDETGQEEFKSEPAPQGKPVIFGFAGVAGFGPSIARAERHWQALNVPGHMSEQKLTREQLGAVSDFIRQHRVGRFAYLIKKPLLQIAGTNALHLLRPFLLDELLNFVSGLAILPDEVVIVIEQSDRLMPKIVGVLPGLQLEVDGKAIPIKGLFSPKSQPLLQICDHICHRAQRQYNFSSGDQLMPEFVAVFPQDAPFGCYRELEVATYEGGTNPKWSIVLDRCSAVRVRFHDESKS